MSALTTQQVLEKHGLSALWNPQDALMPMYVQIANTYKTNKTPEGFVDTVIANLIARQFLYYKKSVGDCGTQTRQSTGNVGSDISRIGSFGALGASTFAAGSSLAATGSVTAGLAVAGSAAAVAAEAASIVGLAVLPFTIWGMFGAAHKRAVGIEQSDLCAVMLQVNPTWQNIDAAVAAQQMTVTKAIGYLTQMSRYVKSELSSIVKECNAACTAIRTISAINDLRTYLYKSANQEGGSAAVIQTAQSLLKTNNI